MHQASISTILETQMLKVTTSPYRLDIPMGQILSEMFALKSCPWRSYYANSISNTLGKPVIEGQACSIGLGKHLYSSLFSLDGCLAPNHVNSIAQCTKDRARVNCSNYFISKLFGSETILTLFTWIFLIHFYATLSKILGDFCCLTLHF